MSRLELRLAFPLVALFSEPVGCLRVTDKQDRTEYHHPNRNMSAAYPLKRSDTHSVVIET